MPRPITYICYADDDPDDHFIFSMVMSEEFPAIKCEPFYHCGDLLRNLNSVENPLPDVIFLDYNMPGNNGNECLKMVKKTARLMHIPVIIYSTSDFSRVLEQSYRDGAYKYLVKASDINGVRQVLRNTISELESSSNN